MPHEEQCSGINLLNRQVVLETNVSLVDYHDLLFLRISVCNQFRSSEYLGSVACFKIKDKA